MEMGNVSSSTSLYSPLDALESEGVRGSFGCAPAAARKKHRASTLRKEGHQANLLAAGFAEPPHSAFALVCVWWGET